MNSNAKGRLPLYVGLAAALLFIFALVHNQQDSLPASAQKYVPFKNKHSSYDSYEEVDDDSELITPPKSKTSKSSKLSKTSKTSSKDSSDDSSSSKSSKSKSKSKPKLKDSSALSSSYSSEPSFLDIAKKTGTDKVTTHSYHDMYETYLQPVRHKRLKMLEIGLGCDMNYGPGKSYALWLDYFTDVDLYFMEYDAECAKKWASKTDGATIIPGDQEDAVFLEHFIKEYGNDFDVIIDDGGHTMAQQQVSLQHLWKAVKPGGMYFCEDLQTSWWDKYGGGGTAKAAGVLTTVQYIHRLIEDLSMPPRQIQFDDVESMVHIDCSREVCMFRKRGPAEIGA